MVTGLRRTIKLSAFFATSEANLVDLEEEREPFLGSGEVEEGELTVLPAAGWAGVY
jgi:hypothetical protein